MKKFLLVKVQNETDLFREYFVLRDYGKRGGRGTFYLLFLQRVPVYHDVCCCSSVAKKRLETSFFFLRLLAMLQPSLQASSSLPPLFLLAFCRASAHYMCIVDGGAAGDWRNELACSCPPQSVHQKMMIMKARRWRCCSVYAARGREEVEEENRWSLARHGLHKVRGESLKLMENDITTSSIELRCYYILFS